MHTTESEQRLAHAVLNAAVQDALKTTGKKQEEALQAFELTNEWFLHWCALIGYDPTDFRDRIYARCAAISSAGGGN